jgi:hypothetical protein
VASHERTQRKVRPASLRWRDRSNAFLQNALDAIEQRLIDQRLEVAAPRSSPYSGTSMMPMYS